MPRENYRERLDDLRAGVVAMGETVCDRLDDAVEAAVTGDEELARSVIETDHEVNETYLDLEDECTDLLALQQPVAGDLRLVAASFKIITDLERVADLATNLAAYGGPEGGVHPAVDARALGETAREMVADAVAAYAARDADACRERRRVRRPLSGGERGGRPRAAGGRPRPQRGGRRRGANGRRDARGLPRRRVAGAARGARPRTDRGPRGQRRGADAVHDRERRRADLLSSVRGLARRGRTRSRLDASGTHNRLRAQ
jgi:hypothetical protein